MHNINPYGKGRIVIANWQKAKILQNNESQIIAVFQHNGKYTWWRVEYINKNDAESLHERKQNQRK